MTAAGDQRGWLGDWRIAAPVALLLSGLILLVGFWLYYLTGDRYLRQTTLTWSSDTLKLVVGQGETTAEGVRITALSGGGALLRGVLLQPLRAEEYARLRWTVAGRGESVQLHWVWATEQAPQVLQRLALPASTENELTLTDAAGWRGAITGIGLQVSGQLQTPLTVHALALQPAVPGLAGLLAQVGREWLEFNGWRGSSINVTPGGRRDSLWPPLFAVAAWVGLALLIAILLTRARWRVAIVLFLFGWLLLDLRWQGELWYNLNKAHARYAGLSADEKRRAADDGELYNLIARIKQALPAEPVRLLLLTGGTDPADRYVSLRARYHLLPHNVLPVRGLNGLQLYLDGLNSGDYLLALGRIEGLYYRPGSRRLTWQDNRSPPLESVLRTPLASLYRLQ